MARHGKTHPAEDLMDIVALLPWWVGVGLALVSRLLLHSVASQQVGASAQPGQVGGMVAQTLWKTLAGVGLYIVPILCLGGAGRSAWRRRARQKLATDVAQSKATDALDGMSWREFEMLVSEGFRWQGYQVVETGGGGADGGVDPVLTKPGKNGGGKFLVQCKQWRAFKVGVGVVREPYGVMAARGATGCFVVTSGRCNDEAISFAGGRNVNLIDGPKLHGLVRQVKAGIDGSPAKSVAAAAPAVPPSAAPMQAAICPLCSKAMVRRTAGRRAPFQAGVLPLTCRQTGLLFATLDESEGCHARIACHDHAISAERFHWQTQNSAGPDMPGGRRCLESSTNGWQFQLFMRPHEGDAYRACGRAVLEPAEGDRPMSIVRQLQTPLPAGLFRALSVLRGVQRQPARPAAPAS